MYNFQFAEGCAWRCFYLYRGSLQVFRIGIDPSASYGPQILLAIATRDFTFKIPYMRWKMNRSKFGNWMYGIQQRILCGLDGRYGWGTKRS